MAKAMIMNATIEGAVATVEYVTGTIKTYSTDKLPKTVQDFLAKVKLEAAHLEMLERVAAERPKAELIPVEIKAEPVEVSKAEATTSPAIHAEPKAHLNLTKGEITWRKIGKAAKAFGEVIADKALDAEVAMEKTLEAVAPVAGKAAKGLGWLVTLLIKALAWLLPLIWMALVEAGSFLAFWVPEGLRRLGFILSWRVAPWMAKKGKATWRAAKAQWAWAKNLKAEWSFQDEEFWNVA